MSAHDEVPAQAPRKLLVMELAGLGDNIHLLPALWLVRQQWPHAELHVMVNAHVADLFKQVHRALQEVAHAMENPDSKAGF